jgi:hypothetical protein
VGALFADDRGVVRAAEALSMPVPFYVIVGTWAELEMAHSCERPANDTHQFLEPLKERLFVHCSAWALKLSDADLLIFGCRCVSDCLLEDILPSLIASSSDA